MSFQNVTLQIFLVRYFAITNRTGYYLYLLSTIILGTSELSEFFLTFHAFVAFWLSFIFRLTVTFGNHTGHHLGPGSTKDILH